MTSSTGNVAVVGEGIAARVAASFLLEADLDVTLFSEGGPGITSIWNGLGSIFGPASPMPADSAGAIEGRTPTERPFDPTRRGRWQRLVERRPAIHPYARLGLDFDDVDHLIDEALTALPDAALDRADEATIVPGPHGQPYAADLLFPSLRPLDFRTGQKIGFLRHPELSGWDAETVATQVGRASGLTTTLVDVAVFDEAPPGHGVRTARWLADRWDDDRMQIVDELGTTADRERLDVLVIPPIVGSTLPTHSYIWSTLVDEIDVAVAEFPPSSDPIFGWRLHRAFKGATKEAAAGEASGLTPAPVADTVEFRNERAVGVTDRSGTTHFIDAVILTNGRWFGDGLPAAPPMLEPLTGAPIWLDGAPLSDDRQVYPPDLLDALPWDDHRLFRAGLPIDRSGRLLNRHGEPFPNIHAAGRGLAGFNPFHDGCSLGVDLVSGLCAARRLVAATCKTLEERQPEPDSLETH